MPAHNENDSTLPGLSFPREVSTYPSRSQVIAYLESYAARFGITPRFGERLERACPTDVAGSAAHDAGWEVQTSSQRYRASHLIMATGLNRTPLRPVWPRQKLFRGPLDIGTVARITAGDIEVVPEIEAFSASGVTLRNGATREVDVVVLATGYRSGLEELLDAPSSAPNIHFVGYRNSITGLLRRIGIEAENVARVIANREPPTTNH